MESQAQYRTSLSQWGNSKAVRLPAAILKKLNLLDNQTLLVSVEDNSIRLSPENTQPSTIHELFAEWDQDDVREGELDWGQAKGQELEW